MQICPQCGRRHGVSSSLCPDCRQSDDFQVEQVPCDESLDHELLAAASLGERVWEVEFEDAQEADRAVAIARFQSGAEAGYFADELTRQNGIEAEVLVRERFDAVHAVWTVDYILQVSPVHAEAAAGALQSLVDATGDDAGDESAASCVTELPSGVWVPLILTLAAGSIACFGFDHLDHRPRQAALVVGDRRNSPELWEILAATDGPWVQQLDGGRGMRRLRLNPDHHTAVLEEDHDGDGRVDREWEFSWHAR